MSFGTSGASQLNKVGEVNGAGLAGSNANANAVLPPGEQEAVTVPDSSIFSNGHGHVALNEDGNGNENDHINRRVGVEVSGSSNTHTNTNSKNDTNTDGHGHGNSNGGDHPPLENLVAEAISTASLNALRLALYQATGDPELGRMKVSKQAIRGGAMQDYVLSEEDSETVRAKARDFLLHGDGGKQAPPPPPSKEQAEKLMETFTGHALNQAEKDLGYEELAFTDFPRELHWDEGKRPSAETLSKYRVAIIGAGICGISAAIHLQRLGIPYIGIERQAGFGGTWLLNTYPQARVDTLGFLFQYKFMRGYRWDENFPSGPALLSYLQKTAADYRLKEQFVFGRQVIGATWDEATGTWVLELEKVQQQQQQQEQDGSVVEQVRVNAIISASGLFNQPCLPDIPGIDEFQGQICHTTTWDDSYHWRGKKVALIGNGSSGAQLMPELARGAAQLTVYQRTPQWMAGFDGYRDRIPESTHWLMDRLPFYREWFGYTCFMRGMQLPPLQVYDRDWQARGGLVNERNDRMRRGLVEYIRTKVKGDADLVRKLTPDYAPLVRRLVVDNGFYDALLRPNVELETNPIVTFTRDGITTVTTAVTTAANETRPTATPTMTPTTTTTRTRNFDLVVLACGFKPTEYLWPIQFRGRAGVTLDQTWAKDGARSYLGLVMPGYPNLWCLYGPNHQPRGGPSIHSFAEIWGRYALSSIKYMLQNDIRSLAVKQHVYDEYNARLDAAMANIIWEAEGRGYFVNRFGRQAVNMPWTSDQYYDMVKEVNFADFDAR
ncbi:hypothetical protein A1O3_03122 [Capronia epimyces CBS 606.96]|uniref:FAD/NAD(P)-binding domain-containing protein n=1 Tax=Capronia epimyces CBS 606.96 TaxID=1182542 RepID=W9Z6D5_9EURO|nr:uncharacterized protein A1O3_03122 [Capronia epimyces CBS 606.96]EXJ90054.1 hypothetical protein A1O3_03122 [Capronia epimyces CBS 606.96]